MLKWEDQNFMTLMMEIRSGNRSAISSRVTKASPTKVLAQLTLTVILVRDRTLVNFILVSRNLPRI